MGTLRELRSSQNKMKLASALVGIAAAHHGGSMSGHGESTETWLINTWWEKAVEVFNFKENNWGDFSAAVGSVDDSFFAPAWNFCNEDGAEIVAKYWYVIDADHSDSLSWDEWRYTQAAFAAVDSLVVLEAFDADENGMMDSSELRTWRLTMQKMLAEYGWQPNAGHVAAMTAAWAKSQTDEDPFSASMMELARFTILMWNSFLQ